MFTWNTACVHVLIALLRTQLVLRVNQHDREMEPVSGNCRRVKWCPCTLDDDDDDDDDMSDDTSKLLVVSDVRSVSGSSAYRHRHISDIVQFGKPH